MKKIVNKLSAASITLLFCVSSFASEVSQDYFTTQGNGLRQITSGTVNGQPVVYTSELDGAVASYSSNGEELWRSATQNKAVLFEINSTDLNNDQSDELIAASADGSIYAWDTTSKNKVAPLWKFTPPKKVRFSEVAVARVDGEKRIYAGGNNFILYELNSNGQLLSETKLEGVVRKIESGRFLSSDKDSLFVFTLDRDKYRWDFMGFIDPKSKKVISKISPADRNVKDISKNMMITDIDIADLDQDGLDDLLFFGDYKSGQKSAASFVAYNSKFKRIADFKIASAQRQRYAHVYGTSLLPKYNEIVLQFGGLTYLIDAKGKLIKQVGEKHTGLIFNDIELSATSEKLFAAGQIGGGNTIYSFDLNNKNWLDTPHQLTGRLAQVEKNINDLYEQTLAFEMPSYQKKSNEPWVMLTKAELNSDVEKLNGADFLSVAQERWTEKWDRSQLVKKIGKIALKQDRRGKYKDTREQLIKKAKAFEAKGKSFVVWSGHGIDPFGVSIDTMEAILEAAPNTALGFLYAEMHDPKDPRVLYFISEYMPRLAKAMRKQGKAKLYFRYKDVFWATTSQQQPWKDMFFSGQYADILVPSAEDTTSRTQDINFTGRVGMFLGGYVNDYAMRLVDDNPTSWRPLSPGGQRSVSPYLRTAVLRAAYGSRMGIIFDSRYTEQPGLNVLFALMKSGVLPIVEKDAMQSIGSWMLIKDVDIELAHSITNHHEMNHYSENDSNALMSLGQIQWAGTNLPKYDYSRAALGVQYRWLNFIPPMPNGMIPIAPIESAAQLKKQNTPYFVSNGRVGFSNDKEIGAEEFYPEMQHSIELGAQNLPIRVEGSAWSVIKLDEKHSRIILVDQGYIDPQDRDVTIHFHKKAKWVKDILSKEAFHITDNKMNVTVPAGSVRFFDVGY
ncbi:hypothetical protein I6F40_18965 [Pseudoalteromonas sp. SWXJ133]|uniref:hypothetical protein n=1 Tax=unclassified Pseudoalteromonas TaxID=194690 RepID=UPI00140CBA15|nr:MULTISPECIES: hypothetical protein [unclassified Pseudoalteromonas]MBH0022402.1 hypothetical protein [Pseudoalteromonas sp. SWXJ133]